MSRARDFADLAGSADAGGITGKNMVVNGSMAVSQRGTSSTSGTGYNTVDRVNIVIGNTDELSLTQAQVSDAPDGFANSYKLTTSTAETTLAADERVAVDFVLEAQNLQQLKYGTASAESVTLSFWVKSSVTGNYAFWLYQDDATRTYSTTYTVNSANTWEQKIITVPGDTSGVINDDNGRGMTLRFHVAAGSNYVGGTQNSWLAYATNTEAAGQVADIATTLNATWQITGVQLEVGEQATPFEHEDVGTTTRKCQRYYYRTVSTSSNNFLGYAMAANTTNMYLPITFPTTMRSNPSSIDVTAGSGGNIGYWLGGAVTAFTSVSIAESGTGMTTLNCAVGSGLSAEKMYGVLPNGSGSIGFNAEL